MIKHSDRRVSCWWGDRWGFMCSPNRLGPSGRCLQADHQSEKQQLLDCRLGICSDCVWAAVCGFGEPLSSKHLHHMQPSLAFVIREEEKLFSPPHDRSKNPAMFRASLRRSRTSHLWVLDLQREVLRRSAGHCEGKITDVVLFLNIFDNWKSQSAPTDHQTACGLWCHPWRRLDRACCWPQHGSCIPCSSSDRSWCTTGRPRQRPEWGTEKKKHVLQQVVYSLVSLLTLTAT